MKTVNDLRGHAVASNSADAKSLSLRDRLRAGSEGQSLVEFALVLPILLMVLTGIFMIGVIMLNYQTLTQAVNQGGMALQQLPGMTGSSDPCSAVATTINTSAANLNTSSIQLTVQMGSYTSPTQSASAATCAGGASYAQQGLMGTVTATYPCNLSFYGFQFSSSCKLYATSQELMQ